MATPDQYEKMGVKERQYRYFSEEFKRKKVSEIERNLVSVCAVSREYQVSRSAIYKWIYSYSKARKKKERLVMESKSDTQKLIELQKKVKELEQIVGQKQIQIDFLNKMIELTEKDLSIDIKKKGSTPR